MWWDVDVPVRLQSPRNQVTVVLAIWTSLEDRAVRATGMMVVGDAENAFNFIDPGGEA